MCIIYCKKKKQTKKDFMVLEKIRHFRVNYNRQSIQLLKHEQRRRSQNITQLMINDTLILTVIVRNSFEIWRSEFLDEIALNLNTELSFYVFRQFSTYLAFKSSNLKLKYSVYTEHYKNPMSSKSLYLGAQVAHRFERRLTSATFSTKS